jgi:hypothetical protein
MGKWGNMDIIRSIDNQGPADDQQPEERMEW